MCKAHKAPCAFCPATANITGEHLWSNWVNELVGKRLYSIVREMQDGRNISWKSVGLNEKAKVVCDACNGGWMSVIESETKSVLGEIVAAATPKAFTTTDVNVISRFSFLKAVVCDHLTDKNELFYTVAERHSFRKTLSIPDCVRIWFGATLPNHGVFKSSDVVMPSNVPNRFQLNVFTYSLGHFVIQVVGSRWSKKSARRHTRPPALTQAPAWIPVSTRLWPHDLSVSWPPNTFMAEVVLDEFAVRWKRLQFERRLGLS